MGEAIKFQTTPDLPHRLISVIGKTGELSLAVGGAFMLAIPGEPLQDAAFITLGVALGGINLLLDRLAGKRTSADIETPAHGDDINISLKTVALIADFTERSPNSETRPIIVDGDKKKLVRGKKPDTRTSSSDDVHLIKTE